MGALRARVVRTVTWRSHDRPIRCFITCAAPAAMTMLRCKRTWADSRIGAEVPRAGRECHVGRIAWEWVGEERRGVYKRIGGGDGLTSSPRKAFEHACVREIRGERIAACGQSKVSVRFGDDPPGPLSRFFDRTGSSSILSPRHPSVAFPVWRTRFARQAAYASCAAARRRRRPGTRR